jgi:S-layer protein
LLSATTTSVNASGYSSSLRLATSNTATAVTISGSGTADVITGGTGNDTFTVTSTGYTDATAPTSPTLPTAIAYAVAGGTGTDTLNLTVGTYSTSVTDATVSVANVSAVENFNIVIPSSVATTVTSVAGFNDAVATNIVFTGGNSLSSLTVTAGAVGSGAAFKSFDASAISGTVSLIADPGAISATADTVRGGSGSSDSLRVTFAGTGSGAAIPVVSGFESMFVTTSTNDSAAQNFGSTTGLATITVGGSNSFTATGLASGVALTVGQTGTAAAATSVGAFTAGKTISFGQATVTGTADSQTVNLVRVNGNGTVTLALPGIETVNLNESSSVAATPFTFAIDTNISGVANANSVTINVSGGVAGTQTDTNGTSASTRDVTFASGGLQSNVAVLNAAAYVSGALIMNDGSRVGATAMTITGAGGNDTIIMKAGGDVLTAGSGTDTLKVVANAVIGGFSFDLSSSTDQVIQYAGSVNSALQTGFEYLDLAGVTGNFGADITGRSAANQIVATGVADNVVTGSANDTITGGAGGDTINVGSGTDRLVYTLLGQSGSIVQTTTTSLSGSNLSPATGAFDVVTGMARGDQIQFASGIGSTLSGYTSFSTVGAVGTTSLVTGTSNQNTFALVQGTYLSTGVFAVTSSGADLLLEWDSDGTGTSGTTEAVVLIGANSGSTTNITGIVATTAGVLTFI